MLLCIRELTMKKNPGEGYAPKGMILRCFGLESGMVFGETTGVYERIYHFNSKWIRKKEKYANSKWILRNSFLFVFWSTAVSDSGGHNFLEARSENRCEKWHFFVWNKVKIWRTGRHTPTKNSQKYLPGREKNTSFVKLLPVIAFLS